MSAIFDLNGKNALITGSTRGIGLAIAQGLAELGARIMLHGQAESQAAAAACAQLRSISPDVACAYADLSKSDGAENLFNQTLELLGPTDILILNTSIQIRRRWMEISDADFDMQMHVNWLSALKLIRLCYPHMQRRKWGRIIVIGSTQQVKPHPEMLVYGATKCALASLVENLALQFAPDGITINCVAPGTIDTDRNTAVLSDSAYRQQCETQIPLGFVGQPRDCVPPVLMLCSNESRYITGVNMFVDGGKHI